MPEQPSGFDSSYGLPSGATLGSRWMGWRLRLLVGFALLGCLGVFLLAQQLAATRTVDAHWRATAAGRIELVASGLPALQPLIGEMLVAVSAGTRTVELPDALTLQRSARWLPDDGQRERQRLLHERLSTLLEQPLVELHFADGSRRVVGTTARGFRGLPLMYWVMSALAMSLWLIAMTVPMAKPNGRNLLYAVMTAAQAGNLVLIAVESTLDLRLPPPWPALDMPLRMALDLFSAAAIVSAIAVHPRVLPGAGWIALAGWVLAAVLVGLALQGRLAHAWWWTQGSVFGFGLAMVAMARWSYRFEPHPLASVLHKLGWATLVTWTLLTVALAAAGTSASLHQNIASIGSMAWALFFSSVLLLVPFLSRSQQLLREFALLAAVSTVATSLDLLFVAVFALGSFASLTLSLFVALAVYAGARQWIVNQLLGSSVVTTERMFEQLYRIAREVEAHPDRVPVLLGHLLREVFEPMEVLPSERAPAAARLVGEGSGLVVPVPRLEVDGAPAAQGALLLRFAHRGRRLFTSEDVRLADRIIEQLRRAIAFDKAVEQGRSEERARIAQDLHDDIGARLLTLIYTAPTPEMEDYVRHTLQDLKTLTRGLAAANHRLSHAAAEWKADLTQRLTAVHIELGWTFEFDEDVMLNVVQWSALTRVLRELASNVIAHAQARRVEIEFSLRGDRLDLRVRDDGIGRNPPAWSHGLGLGGVRKRLKQLGGEVEWRELSPRGIECEVRIREFSRR